MKNPPGLRPLPILDVPRAMDLDTVPVSFSLLSSGGPYWFDAVGLPPGLVIDHQTGVISGTPTVGGEYVVKVSSVNYVGFGEDTVVMRVVPTVDPLAPEIASAMFDTTCGHILNYAVMVTQGPVTSFTCGSLPYGLAIEESTGFVSGYAMPDQVRINFGATNLVSSFPGVNAWIPGEVILTFAELTGGLYVYRFDYDIDGTHRYARFEWKVEGDVFSYYRAFCGTYPTGGDVNTDTCWVSWTTPPVGNEPFGRFSNGNSYSYFIGSSTWDEYVIASGVPVTYNCEILATNAHGTGTAVLTINLLVGSQVTVGDHAAEYLWLEAGSYKIYYVSGAVEFDPNGSLEAFGIPRPYAATNPGINWIYGGENGIHIYNITTAEYLDINPANYDNPDPYADSSDTVQGAEMLGAGKFLDFTLSVRSYLQIDWQQALSITGQDPNAVTLRVEAI